MSVLFLTKPELTPIICAVKIIVMGKSRQPWHKRITHTSILDRLMRMTHDIDIIIVDV